MKKYTNYILLILLIAVSGFEYFYLNEEWISIGLILSLITVYSRRLYNRLDKKALYIILLFIVLEFVQFLFLGGFRLRPIIGTFARLFFAYFVILILNGEILKAYIKVISIFSIISLMFYILYYLFPGLVSDIIAFSKIHIKPVFSVKETFNSYYKPNIIIFAFHGFELLPMRNSGPFWEPGAFAIYLNLALVFNLMNEKKLTSFKSLLFIITILTTLSTSGIVTLMFIIIVYNYFKTRKRLISLLLIPLLVLFSLSVFFRTEILYDKINTNISLSEVTTTSRFGSAKEDINLFQKNPIIGYGRNTEATYGKTILYSRATHRNNGLTRIFVQYGVFALVILYMIMKSMRNITYMYIRDKYYFLLPFTVILLSSFSQNIFQYPFFMGLMFMQFIRLDEKGIIYVK